MKFLVAVFAVALVGPASAQVAGTANLGGPATDGEYADP